MNKVFDFVILIAFFIIAAINSLFFLKSPTIAILIYMVPVFYFIYKKPEIIKKCYVFVILFGIFYSVFFFYADLNNAWKAIHEIETYIDGVVVGNLEFAFLWPLSAIAIYHHFFKPVSEEKIKTDRSFYYFVAIFTLIVSTLQFSGVITNFKYSYLLLGGVTIGMQIIYGISRRLNISSELKKNFILMGILFFCASALWEAIYVPLGWWKFNGDYVALINILGTNVPIEEVIFWTILGVPTMLYNYEAAKK